jgi:hypothetical protein
MDEAFDKIVGQLPQLNEQVQFDANQLLEKRKQQMHAAADRLQELVKNKEVQRIGYAIQFAHRLLQWAQQKAAQIKGIDPLALIMFVEAQVEHLQQPADFDAIMRDFERNQLPWLKEQLLESAAQDRVRKKRIRKIKEQLQRKDIPLPVHSLDALFDEQGFDYNQSLALIGDAEAVSLVLRWIAMGYQQAGGLALLLANRNEPEPEHIAKISLRVGEWCGKGTIFATLAEQLDPLLKHHPQNMPGLLVVDNLDLMVDTRELSEMPRPVLLQQAFSTLKTYQLERGMALLVGIHTNDDPDGIDPLQIYPPLIFQYPFVQVKMVQSQLTGGDRNVIIGNDLITLQELTSKLEA